MKDNKMIVLQNVKHGNPYMQAGSMAFFFKSFIKESIKDREE